jgi:hypothetical protein
LICESRTTFWLLVIVILLAAVFYTEPAYCATGAPRHDNSLGVVQYVDNPNTYLFAAIVNQPGNPNRVVMDGKRRMATILTFQPYNTFNLFTESVTFCGNLAAAFSPMRGAIVVTYKTVAHEMVNGVACHEFVDVFPVSLPDEP